MTKRIAALAVTVAFGVGGVATPALGAGPSHWTAAKCESYKKSFLKEHHKKPTKKQIAAADKVLKKHGCKIKA